MLAQQRRYIAAATDSRHLKLIAELYDKCQETLYQVPLYPHLPPGAPPASTLKKVGVSRLHGSKGLAHACA
jgi:hypothetical protein